MNCLKCQWFHPEADRTMSSIGRCHIRLPPWVPKAWSNGMPIYQYTDGCDLGIERKAE